MSHLEPQYVSIRHCIHAIERSLYISDRLCATGDPLVYSAPETWLRVVSVIHLDPRNANRRVPMVLNFCFLAMRYLSLRQITSRTFNLHINIIFKKYIFIPKYHI